MKVIQLQSQGTDQIELILRPNTSGKGVDIKHEEGPTIIQLKKNRYCNCCGDWKPLKKGGEKYYEKIYTKCYKRLRIYSVNETMHPTHATYLGLTLIQEQRFRWIQGDHWWRKENNIRYVINLAFLLVGIWFAYLQTIDRSSKNLIHKTKPQSQTAEKPHGPQNISIKP